MIHSRLSRAGTADIHDLGCGTGAMARWLSPRLPCRQRWFLYDQDPVLLDIAEQSAYETRNRALVDVQVRRSDVTLLDDEHVRGADLVTASALLDVLTSAELERLIAVCATARCPMLLALNVNGRVELTPGDPMDPPVGDAFNAHQRRTIGSERLLGPRAITEATNALTSRGYEVLAWPSPWWLGPDQSAVAREWFTRWLTAACAQRPELVPPSAAYARRRTDQLAAGQLSVVVDHVDLLALPPSP